jgi:hypothetical protein
MSLNVFPTVFEEGMVHFTHDAYGSQVIELAQYY